MKQEMYTCFNDYPQDIQKEAFEVLNEGDPLGYFNEVIRRVHLGDETTIELILLSVASLFVENSKPVHQQIKGDLGSGKTSLLNKTLKVVPERYIKRLNNVSPEYIYSIKNTLNPDYNIFLLDDINLTPATTAMLKTLTDNGLENKVFIKSKDAELKLPGKNLFFCIFAEKSSNVDLEYNLLPNTTLGELEGILWRMGEDEIVGFDENSSSMQHFYSVANAVFEKLIEKPIKTFNPYLIGINWNMQPYIYQKPLDLQRFTGLVKAHSLYHTKQLEQIGDIILGMEPTVDILNFILQSNITMRDYQLSNKQRDLLIELEIYTDELFEKDKKHYKEYYNDSSNPNNVIYRQPPTYENLAKSMEISKNILKKWIKGSETSLEEKGLIKTMKIDYKKRNSKILVYIDPKAKHVKSGLSGSLNEYLNLKDRTNKLFSHKTMQSSLLERFTKINNTKNCKTEIKYINTFLEEEAPKLNSYEDLVKYLKKFKTGLSAI